ncbi:MAG: hypothetical protein H0T79_09795 [Deltaproteobacteria bacterium]|nr:hypothetical protein [Deltaproteobacteria bacterium]
MKKILIVAVGAAIVLGIVFGARAWKHSKQASETASLAKVLEVAERPVRAEGEAVDAKKPSFGTLKERAAAVLDIMTKEGTDALGHAFKAGLLFDLGKFDEAIAEYRSCETQEGLDGVLCREGLALSLEGKAAANQDSAARQKGFEDALAAFKTMQPEDTGLRAAYAHYHQARLLALLGKRDDAKAAFEKAKELGKDLMDLPELIEKRLATLGA